MAGIYVHIPFCKQACSYCNFHFSTSETLKPDVIRAIGQELISRKEFLADQTVNSLYFGGGTPSLLTEGELQYILDTVFHNYRMAAAPEITLEANPDDLTDDTVRRLADSPVNRLSIGIQSFFEEDLRYMHRVHTALEAVSALERCLLAGFNALSIDLIYGTPTLSASNWVANLTQVAEFGIQHLSAYQLTVEPRTALEKYIAKGLAASPNDADVLEQFETLMDWAAEQDYAHYEISNFARPGFRALHNSNYWKRELYLGVGPSAHSFDGARRAWNIANNALYVRMMTTSDLAIEDEETLTPADVYNETVLTGLRTSDGVGLESIRSVGDDFVLYFEKMIADSVARGLVQQTDMRYTLTRKGKHFADRIASNCFVTDPA